MSEGWTEEEFERVEAGLLLLGWRFDSRLTADDSIALERTAEKALSLQKAGTLTSETRDALALEAFEGLQFQLMNVDERTLMTTWPYSRSPRIRPMVPLVDEATLCYYRGYFTASLALLFFVVEHVLRDLSGWHPPQPKPSFRKLRESVNALTDPDLAAEAGAIVGVIYSNYEADSPPAFFFNRHGLLHGLRGRVSHDRMNCARIYGLLDVVTFAEGGSRSGEMADDFRYRHAVYSRCVNLGAERQLLEQA